MAFSKIIFDFDHTLVELGPHVDWRQAISDIKSIYIEEGIPSSVVEQAKGLGLKLMRTVYDYMLEVYSPDRVSHVQGRVFNSLERYELLGVKRATPIDGTASLLSWLHSNNYHCAIVSSNGRYAIQQILDRLGWNAYFKGIFGRDASCRLKPFPDQNRACLALLGWEREDTMLVGDSPDDILSAKPLSLFTVGVVSGLAKEQRLIEAGADRIIHSIGELPVTIQIAG